MEEQRYTKDGRYSGIYTALKNNKKNYYARFTLRKKAYPYINLTELVSYPKYPVTSAKEAAECLVWLKHQILDGNDPRKPTFEHAQDTYLVDAVEELWEARKDEKKSYKNMYSSFRKNFLPVIPKRLKMGDISQNPSIVRKLLSEMIGNIESRGDRADNVVMNVKKVLNPVFDYAIENPAVELQQNPLHMKSVRDLLRRFSAKGKKERLFQRIEGDYVDVARGIIESARRYETKRAGKISTKELRLLFLLAFSTARRTEELLRLRMSDIDLGKKAVFVRGDTAKNQIEDIYPLASEVIALLPKKKTGLLFSNSADANAYGKHILNMISEADIPVADGKRVVGHDRRKLFASIMNREIGDSDIVDAYISHVESMKTIYIDLDLENRRNVFKKYWELIGVSDD